MDVYDRIRDLRDYADRHRLDWSEVTKESLFPIIWVEAVGRHLGQTNLLDDDRPIELILSS